MNDKEFREEFKPLHVPARLEDAEDFTGQVIFALAQLDSGSASEITIKLEELKGGQKDKSLIAGVHAVLTELYGKGLLNGEDENGDLKYNLHKITQANGGGVDPDLLAPGLD